MIILWNNLRNLRWNHFWWACRRMVGICGTYSSGSNSRLENRRPPL